MVFDGRRSEHAELPRPRRADLDRLAAGVLRSTASARSPATSIRASSRPRAQNGVKLVPLVMNPGFDQPLIHRVLTVPDARRRAIASLVALCRDNHFDGLQFDIENVHVERQGRVHELRARVGDRAARVNCSVSAAVVPRIERDPGPIELSSVDVRELARRLRLQGAGRRARFHLVHDVRAAHRRVDARAGRGLHVDGGRAQVRSVARRAAVEDLARHPVVLGLVVLDVRREDRRAHARQRHLVRERRRTALATYWRAHRSGTTARKSPYAIWSNTGVYEWLWIEDARAFTAKLELVRKYKLRGYSVWVLGLEDPETWDALAAAR